MTVIDIYSGFLGAGKTTLIKKMIKEAYVGEKLVLIENEFGEIGIDGGFMQEAGIQVNEMNSGCICCSLVGDFGKALEQVIRDYQPDRILIEPSGVGKLSDVIGAVQRVADENVKLGAFVTVADATKCKIYMKNFGEFYSNQIETASAILLSRTDRITEEKLATAMEILRKANPNALILTTPWDQLDGMQIRKAMEGQNSLTEELASLLEEQQHHHDEHCSCPKCNHEHEHHHHDHECCHDHEHHHHEWCHDHEHHHHDHECCHEHEHHHHDHECCHEHEHHHHDHECCHEHEHHHHEHHHHEHHHHEHHHHEHHHHEHHHHEHGHHHADEVFSSWGVESARKYRRDEIAEILSALDQEELYGIVLRAKGIVPCVDDSWIHFDHVPGEMDIREGCAAVTGRLCVIGSRMKEEAIAKLFGV